MNDNEKKLKLILGIKKRGIKDTRILNIIETIDRGIFLDGIFKARSLDDVPLPIKCGQTISQPSVVAMMTEKLELTKRCKVLEIGTGSGYQTAILSKLSRRVYTIERHENLKKKAEKLLNDNGFKNITNILGDGSLGIEKQAPFDRIILTAAAEDVPQILLQQLRIGGIMVLPIGLPQSDQTLIRLRKKATQVVYDEIAKVRFVPLLEGIAFQKGA
ncbi:MAG: protein-L-isoaspartate(D-aspartate) O-methyltransferase [Paracoccaceae bacterium]|nr:protein-L-isoaspartate(D-aspartate) O-methyltransferase [Paracoccaceae bacterium]